MFQFLKNSIINAAGAAIGYLELIGLKYPVKDYRFKVSDTLWRGSRLDARAFADLQKEGFRLIVNLCAENDMDNAPAMYWKIKALHIPIIDNTPPKEEQMIQFLQAVMKPWNQPAYVHCEAGKGRTGVAVACYRIAVQNWDAAAAIKEADEFGMAMPDQEQFISKFAFDLKNGRIEIKDGIISLRNMI